MINLNTRKDLQQKITKIYSYLKKIPFAPNVKTNLDLTRKDKAIMDTNNKKLIKNIDKAEKFINKVLNESQTSLIYKVKDQKRDIDDIMNKEELDKMKRDIILDCDKAKDERIPEIIKDKLIQPNNAIFDMDGYKSSTVSSYNSSTDGK